MTIQNLISEMDADDELEVTRADMVIKGNYRVVALFLQYYDEQYESHERELQIDRTREQKLLASPSEMRILTQGVKIAKSKSKSDYPRPREIADAWIAMRGKKYNKDDKSSIIEFIKGYLNGRRLTNQYRRRVLMSIYDLVNDVNPQKRLKKKQLKSKSKSVRHNIKRDWDEIARQYAGLKDKTTITAFLKKTIGYQGGNSKLFHKALDKLIASQYPIIQKRDVPVFSTSDTSSVG